MDEIIGRNVPEAYSEAIWKMRIMGHSEDSRNGPVLAMPGPTMLTIHNPMERVLFDSVRQANPYFHMAEFIWMMAGCKDARWIARYNSRMLEYADDGISNNGAYGFRWRENFGGDQLIWVVDLLRRDPTTRRAVLGMWDPSQDCSSKCKDLPCNTHVYFRVVDGQLDMTVCNRSNDMIWGMLGANAVHMTMLHELIARGAGLDIGYYRVFTNNLHIYKSLPNYESIMATMAPEDAYRDGLKMVPLLNKDENFLEFLLDAEKAVLSPYGFGARFSTYWFNNVAKPMMDAYQNRKIEEDETANIEKVVADDWRNAAQLWKEWRNEQSGDR